MCLQFYSTRKYYLLEENEIATIKADRVEFCDIHKQEIVKEVKVSDLDMDAAEKVDMNILC